MAICVYVRTPILMELALPEIAFWQCNVSSGCCKMKHLFSVAGLVQQEESSLSQVPVAGERALVLVSQGWQQAGGGDMQNRGGKGAENGAGRGGFRLGREQQWWQHHF